MSVLHLTFTCTETHFDTTDDVNLSQTSVIPDAREPRAAQEGDQA